MCFMLLYLKNTIGLMKIKLTYLLYFVIFLIALRIFRQIQRNTIPIEDVVYEELNQISQTDTGIVIMLIPNKTYYRIGEKPDLDVLLVNNTDSTILLSSCLDGSSDGTRLPYCDLKILNKKAKHRPICLLPNSLLPSDLKWVPSGKSFNIIDGHKIRRDTSNNSNEKPFVRTTLENYWYPRGFEGTNYLLPGNYKVQFHYNTIDTTTFQGWNANEDFELFDTILLHQIPKINIKSNIVTLKYRLF